jgi:hypothetical protein
MSRSNARRTADGFDQDAAGAGWSSSPELVSSGLPAVPGSPSPPQTRFRLRFLLYGTRLIPEKLRKVQQDPASVERLGRDDRHRPEDSHVH